MEVSGWMRGRSREDGWMDEEVSVWTNERDECGKLGRSVNGVCSTEETVKKVSKHEGNRRNELTDEEP